MFSILIQRRAIVSVDGTFFKKFCLKLVSRPKGSIMYILASLLLPLFFSSMGITLSYSRPLGGLKKGCPLSLFLSPFSWNPLVEL